MISVPFIKASIITSSLSSKAFSMAGCISSLVFTLVTPKLEPPALGLMKQGRPILLITSSSVISNPLRRISDSATRIPKPFRYWLQVNLLKVMADTSTLQLE